MNKLYTLVINGKPEGPFTVDELKKRGIRSNDFVRTEGMDDYKEVHEMPELREAFNFRRQTVAPQYFAAFDQRLLASVIDWFMISFGYVVIAIIGVVATDNRIIRVAIGVSLLILIPLTKIIYHIIMEASAKKATYGKQLLKIKVCDIEGNRLAISHSIWRNLAKVFSVATIGIGYLMSFFNKRQQCLHDMVTDTIVMKDRLV
jgi:uncharacterized RDD family membrane protein YckC